MSFITRLLELPDHISGAALALWCDVKSVCHLDSACCSKTTRDGLFGLFRADAFVFQNIPSREFPDLEPFYAWMLKRRLKLKEIWVEPEYVTATVLNDLLRFTGNKVTSCSLNNIHSNMIAFSTVMALHCRNIKKLEVENCCVDASLHDLLQACPNLLELRFDECKQLNEFCFEDVTCSLLRSLSVLDCEYDSACVAPMLNMSDNIEELQFADNQHVTDTALAAIAVGCCKLCRLSLRGTNVSDTTIAQISASCRDLTEIDMNNCTLLTDASVVALADNSKQLKVLWMNHNSNLTDAAVIAIRKRKRRLFSNIDFSDCPHISLDALVSLAQSGQPYYAYTFGAEANDENFAISIIRSLPAKLKRLIFHDNEISDEVLMAIAQSLTSLDTLNIYTCEGYGADGLAAIATECTQLEDLFVNAMDELAQKLWWLRNPYLEIHTDPDDASFDVLF